MFVTTMVYAAGPCLQICCKINRMTSVLHECWKGWISHWHITQDIFDRHINVLVPYALCEWPGSLELLPVKHSLLLKGQQAFAHEKTKLNNRRASVHEWFATMEELKHGTLLKDAVTWGIDLKAILLLRLFYSWSRPIFTVRKHILYFALMRARTEALYCCVVPSCNPFPMKVV